jgi:Bacteriophage replication protein O
MSDTTKPYEFAGFSSPNTTPVPDVLFDELLLRLDNAELRVLLYIIRRTYGFKRSTDDIAISQMVDGIRKKDGTILDRGTGMSKGSVTRGLRGLLEKGVIVARRNTSKEHGFEPTTYALKLKNEAQPLVSPMRQAPLVSPADPLVSPARHTRNSFTTNRSFEYSNGCAKNKRRRTSRQRLRTNASNGFSVDRPNRYCQPCARDNGRP